VGLQTYERGKLGEQLASDGRIVMDGQGAIRAAGRPRVDIDISRAANAARDAHLPTTSDCLPSSGAMTRTNKHCPAQRTVADKHTWRSGRPAAMMASLPSSSQLATSVTDSSGLRRHAQRGRMPPPCPLLRGRQRAVEAAGVFGALDEEIVHKKLRAARHTAHLWPPVCVSTPSFVIELRERERVACN
jgi:hypothetical protein